MSSVGTTKPTSSAQAKQWRMANRAEGSRVSPRGNAVTLSRSHPKRAQNPLNQGLADRGFRFTPQRQHVYRVLLHKRDHPTAEEVFFRAKPHMPDISMATVYNCLDALVKCGLARQVTLERGATRFCPNMREHSHFYCDACQSVFDIDAPPRAVVRLPAGFRAERFDLAIHGSCPACSKKRGHE